MVQTAKNEKAEVKTEHGRMIKSCVLKNMSNLVNFLVR
jgi:hypothetical protein